MFVAVAYAIRASFDTSGEPPEEEMPRRPPLLPVLLGGGAALAGEGSGRPRPAPPRSRRVDEEASLATARMGGA
jgi:hypothetical protein